MAEPGKQSTRKVVSDAAPSITRATVKGETRNLGGEWRYVEIPDPGDTMEVVVKRNGVVTGGTSWRATAEPGRRPLFGVRVRVADNCARASFADADDGEIG